MFKTYVHTDRRQQANGGSRIVGWTIKAKTYNISLLSHVNGNGTSNYQISRLADGVRKAISRRPKTTKPQIVVIFVASGLVQNCKVFVG